MGLLLLFSISNCYVIKRSENEYFFIFYLQILVIIFQNVNNRKKRKLIKSKNADKYINDREIYRFLSYAHSHKENEKCFLFKSLQTMNPSRY